jgi:hypothetical protein
VAVDYFGGNVPSLTFPTIRWILHDVLNPKVQLLLQLFELPRKMAFSQLLLA